MVPRRPRAAAHAEGRHRLRLLEAKTTYGVIGVKVWVYRGDRLANGEVAGAAKTEARKTIAVRAAAACPVALVDRVAARRPWLRRDGARRGAARRRRWPRRCPDVKRAALRLARRRARRKENNDAATSTSQVPQRNKGRNTGIATAVPTCRSAISASRPPSAPHHGAPDRGRAPRHLAPHQARRRIFIRIFPDKADFAEAGRGSDGQRQGQPEYYVAEIVRARCFTR